MLKYRSLNFFFTWHINCFHSFKLKKYYIFTESKVICNYYIYIYIIWLVFLKYFQPINITRKQVGNIDPYAILDIKRK